MALELAVLIVTVQDGVVLDLVTPQPFPCVGVDGVQSEVRASGAEPYLRPFAPERSCQLRSSGVARHPALHSALAVCQLGFPVRPLSYAHELVEAETGVDVLRMWHWLSEVALGEPQEVAVIIAERPVDVQGDDWFGTHAI